MNQQLGISSTCYLLPLLLSVVHLKAFNATTFIRAIGLHPVSTSYKTMWGPKPVTLYRSHTCKDGNSALSENQAYSPCLYLSTKSLPFSGALFLFLEILLYKDNYNSWAMQNLIYYLSALLLALKILHFFLETERLSFL